MPTLGANSLILFGLDFQFSLFNLLSGREKCLSLLYKQIYSK